MSQKFRFNEKEFIDSITFNDALDELENLCKTLCEEVAKNNNNTISAKYLMYETYIKKLRPFVEKYEELEESYLDLLMG